ncbi:MAG: hypothetical protein JST70_11735 [Bacteroidetes bacterium]|nr:hypothetical protein [Bacteroidota bacterium]
MATNKNQRIVKRMKVSASPVIDRNILDKAVIDTVLKVLYNNADKDALHLENEIYKPNRITLPKKEAERLWAVMIASGWVSPVIGFGNAGKLELTREGYQLMAQYGGYAEYLNAINNSQQQQTLILPFQVEEQKQESAPITPETTKKAAQKGDK